MAQLVSDLLFRSVESVRPRLGQEEPGLALLGDAAAGGAMSDNEGIEGKKQQKKLGGDHPPFHGIFITL